MRPEPFTKAAIYNTFPKVKKRKNFVKIIMTESNAREKSIRITARLLF